MTIIQKIEATDACEDVMKREPLYTVGEVKELLLSHIQLFATPWTEPTRLFCP